MSALTDLGRRLHEAENNHPAGFAKPVAASPRAS